MGVPWVQLVLVPLQTDAASNHSRDTHVPHVPLGAETCSHLSVSGRNEGRALTSL